MQIIDPGHSLAKLAKVVDWDRLEAVFGSTFCPDNGRPAISTRLMVALHYLKYTHNLSDELDHFYLQAAWRMAFSIAFNGGLDIDANWRGQR